MAALDRPDLADLLVRLGLRTLGDLAALPGIDLATRFGPEGARAARLATGLDEHPRGARRPPPDLRVSAELDPPADRVDVAAFTAKTLADELVARLDHLGLACTRLRIEAETDQAETLSRVWRYTPPPPRPPTSPPAPTRSPIPQPPPPAGHVPGVAGTLPARMAAIMAERVRWQLDGLLPGRTGNPPGALTHLTLIPDEVVPTQGRPARLLGSESAINQRAARALARIQGLLGPEAIQTAHLQAAATPPPASPSPREPNPGARPPEIRVAGPGARQGGRRWARDREGQRCGVGVGELPARSGPVPCIRSRLAPRPPSPPLPHRGRTGFPTRGAGRLPGAVPWPGRVPAPAPAIMYAEAVPAEVVDATGATVAVDGRGLSARSRAGSRSGAATGRASPPGPVPGWSTSDGGTRPPTVAWSGSRRPPTRAPPTCSG